MALDIFSDQQVFDQLYGGVNWRGSEITFSFLISAEQISNDFGERTGFTPLTIVGQNAAKLAIALWDELIIPNFVEVAGAVGVTIRETDIEFGLTNTEVGFAHAYFPNLGTVWFNSDYGNQSGANNIINPTVGEYGFLTYIHEIGHALGLDHMGDYNGADGDQASSFQDSIVYTVMSYYGPGSARGGEGQVAWADWRAANGILYSPQTPMINDAYVIQEIYGRDTSTRIGDTTYGFNSTTNGLTAQIFDFEQNQNPIITIFDAAGNDTLDLSGWTTPSVIDLEPGSFSSANSMTNNITISQDTVIENAVGGSGADKIYGNASDNILIGGAGADFIYPGSGDDEASGGSGDDQFFITSGFDTILGGQGNDTVNLEMEFSKFTVLNLGDHFRLSNESLSLDAYDIENFIFSDSAFTASNIPLSEPDTENPFIINFYPSNNATSVNTNSNIEIQFSEAIRFDSGVIVIIDNNNSDSVFEFFDVSSGENISIMGSLLVIDPDNTFESENRYSLIIPEGSITDGSGNLFTQNQTYQFTTGIGDNEPPIIIQYNPGRLSEDIEVNSDISVRFNELIKLGTGNIEIRSGSPSGVLFESFDVELSQNISIDGDSITINPSDDLSGSNEYFIIFDQGAITDNSGNAFVQSEIYSFSTSANLIDDFPNDTSTGGLVVVGPEGSIGQIESSGDADAFRIELLEGEAYTFSAERVSGDLDTILALFDSETNLLDSNDDFSGSINSQISFTPDNTGAFFLQVSGYSDTTGAYSLTASVEDNQAPDIISIDPSDGAFGIDLDANIVIGFSENIEIGVGLIDIRVGGPVGELFESFGGGNNSRMIINENFVTIDPISEFDEGERYFVIISSDAFTDGNGNELAGDVTFEFSVSGAVDDDFSDDVQTSGAVVIGAEPSLGEINFDGDRDAFRVTLEEGNTYVFSMDASSNTIDPYLRLLDDSFAELESNDDANNTLNAQIIYSPNRSGTFYLVASDYADSSGSYMLTGDIIELVDDFDNNADTLGRLIIDSEGSAGSIERSGDGDAFRVSLDEGVTYVFVLSRTSGRLDPYLELYDPDDNFIVANDDFGGSLNSQITYTATRDGDYILSAYDYDTGTGDYILSAQLSVSNVEDDFPNSTATTGIIVVNSGSVMGAIEVSEDADVFAVDLIEGGIYSFTSDATTDELDTVLVLWNENLVQVASNDDANGSLNSEIRYSPETSGRFYLQVSGFGSTTGSYTVTVDQTVVNNSPTFIVLPGAIREWQYDGHVYGLYAEALSYTAAGAEATALGGYLLHINSAEEQSDVFSEILILLDEFAGTGTLSDRLNETRAPDGGNAAFIWLGASDAASEGNFVWADDGSALSSGYTHWGSGAMGSEPDNSFNQDYLGLGLENWPQGAADGAGFGNAGFWNDISVNNSLYYVVEKDDDASQSITLDEDTSATVTVSATDADGDTLTYSVTGSASNGTTSVSGDTITYTPAANYNGTDSFIVTADDGNGGTATQTINVTVNAVDEPVASGPTFRLMTFSGWSGSVAGDGNVFGSSGSEAVSLLAGNITFDASFNRGGDGITLTGNSSDYTIARSGSAATLTNGTITATIPLGTAGITLSFDNGTFSLIFSDGFKIGGQSFSSTAVEITASPDGASLPSQLDGLVKARAMVMGDGLPEGQSAHLTIGGTAAVFGSSDNHIVAAATGERVDLTFDASFNRGGDTIVLDLNAGQYTAVRSGSAVVLTADNETFTIPVGTSGLTLSFADGDRTLVFSSGFKIGDDTITSTPTALTPSTTTVSIDVGTDSSRTQVDGSSGATTFTDDASVTTNVQIINFTADDVIAVTNATASDYNYSSNDLDGGGTANDLELSYTNAGITNSIYILNAIADPNAFIFDQTTAQDAIGFSFISFG